MAESKLSKKTFLYSYGKKPCTISSKGSSSVLTGLLTDSDFQRVYNAKTEMDLIIERRKPNTPAININFPCFLLEDDEVLELRFIKRKQHPKSGPKTQKHDQNLHLKRPEDLAMFLVNTTGGKGIKHIVMENKNLKKEVDCVCVVAVKGDTVKTALRKDGRFAKSLFKKDFALEDDERNITKMRNSVEGLKNKLYNIVLNSAGPVADSQDLQYVQEVTDDQSPSACQHSTDPKIPHSSKNGTVSLASDKTKMAITTTLKHTFKDRTVDFIPNTGEILNILRTQFDSLLKQLKDREKVKSSGQVQEFLKEEFSKETQCFSHIKTVKKLMDLSASVCHIRVNNQARGTGFLLFDRFILTNAHVITTNGELLTNLSATFDFEDLSTANKVEFALKRKPVAYKYASTQQHNMDFAVMELKTSGKGLPSPLLKHYSAAPVRGGVCIIGHPDSSVKKMDTCLILEREKQKQTVQKCISEHPEHFQIIGEAYFGTKQKLDDSQIEYHSCFFYGSSGSPVFDEHCNVIGMHTGGYVHEKVKRPFMSLIEYALPLFPILVSILRQTKQKRTHVWKSFSDEKNTKLVMQKAEDETYRPDLTDENVWDAQSSEDEEMEEDNSEEGYEYSGESADEDRGDDDEDWGEEGDEDETMDFSDTFSAKKLTQDSQVFNSAWSHI